MSPSRQAKKYGLKNLSRVTELTGTSPQTLTNWARDKPDLFHIVLIGCCANDGLPIPYKDTMNEVKR